MANVTSTPLVFPIFREPNWTAVKGNGIPYFEAALALQLIVFAWETYVDLRQRRHLQDPQLPPRLVEAFALIETTQKKTKPSDADEAEPSPEPGSTSTLTMRDKYHQSRSYGLDKLSLELVSRSIRLCTSIGLLLAGYLPFAWAVSGRVLERIGVDAQHEVYRTLVFLTITALRDALVAMPFSLYSDFVVEARYGFNKMTLSAFFVNAVKLALLFVPIMYPAVAAVVIVARWAGDLFFLYAPVVWALFMALGYGLTPVLVPLLSKVAPLEDGPLRDKIQELASSQHFPLSNIVVSDESKTSGHSNASVVGIGKTKTIYMDDTLLAEAKDDEVLAVLCHEIGHWKKSHLPRALLSSALGQFAKLYVLGFCMKDAAMYAGFGFGTVAGSAHALVIGYTIFSSAVWLPVERLLKFTGMATARKYEFEADAYATDLGHGEALKTGTTRLLIQNLATLNPDPLYSLYHYHHPSLLERLDAISTRMKKFE